MADKDSESLWPTFTKAAWGTREIVIAILAGVFFVLTVGLAVGLGIHWSDKVNTCVDKNCLSASSYVLTHLNKSVDPCTDFFSYACSGWQSINFLPPDHSQVTVLNQLSDRNAERLREVLESPIKRTSTNSWERKIKELFKSCIDTYENQKAGGQKLINAIMNMNGWYGFDQTYPPTNGGYDFTDQFSRVHVDYWNNALFGFKVAPDAATKDRNVIQIDYAGLGMYWTYYSDPRAQGILNGYKTFVTTIVQLLRRDKGLDDNQAVVTTIVNDVIDFETKLANITQWTQPTDDAHHPVNRLTITDLNTRYGFMDWLRFFRYMFGQNVNPKTQVVLLEQNYLKQVTGLINSLGNDKNRILNNYLVWRVSSSFAQDLSWDYVHANREFYVARTGRKEFLGNWKYCFRFIGNSMQTAFGGLFVRDHFSPSDKQTVDGMFKYMKTTLKDMVNGASWMDSDTRTVALTKIDAIVDKLGYPDMMAPNNDHMLDDFYEKLTVDTGDYFQNLLNLYKFQKSDWTNRLVKGVDKSAWPYSAYDITAHFYNPWNNLFVPAGIMQFPLYKSTLPGFMNFGSLGTLMGHELIHAVDEQGSYYTWDGNIKDWWSTQSSDQYLDRRKCFEDYYTNKTVGPYQVGKTKYRIIIHAKQYAGRAIAETYGVQNAFLSYKKYAADHGKDKLLPGLGLTSEQAFFVAYGQTYCYNRNDVYAFQAIMRGFVPEEFRINGALSHLKEFRDAFKCAAKSKMNAADQCSMF